MTKNKINNKFESNNKKKIISIVLSIFAILFLVVVYKYCFGCLKVPIKSEFYDYEPLISDQIKVSIKDGTLSKNGMILVIENDSTDRVIQYGKELLEPKIFGMWGTMLYKDSVVSNSMLYNILPGEKEELKIDWKEYYGTLSPGRYRYIIHAYTFNEDPNYEEEINKGTYISYEFKI